MQNRTGPESANTTVKYCHGFRMPLNAFPTTLLEHVNNHPIRKVRLPAELFRNSERGINQNGCPHDVYLRSPTIKNKSEQFKPARSFKMKVQKSCRKFLGDCASAVMFDRIFLGTAAQ